MFLRGGIVTLLCQPCINMSYAYIYVYTLYNEPSYTALNQVTAALTAARSALLQYVGTNTCVAIHPIFYPLPSLAIGFLQVNENPGADPSYPSHVHLR